MSHSGRRGQVPSTAIHEALRSPARRTIVAALANRDGPVEVGELGIAVAASDATDPADADAGALVARHVHVPKLASLGFVTWETSSPTVELTEAGRRVAAVDEAVGHFLAADRGGEATTD